jgi:hypothetical protein
MQYNYLYVEKEPEMIPFELEIKEEEKKVIIISLFSDEDDDPSCIII